MIARTRNNGRVELRSAAEWGSTDPWRLKFAGMFSTAGVAVTQDTVLGLPTATYCIRLVSMNVANLYLQVVDCTNPMIPVQHPESWQYQILHNPPADETTGFNLVSDISSQIEGYGNSCIQKVKAPRPGMTGEVVDLVPLDMEKVRIYPDDRTGEKLFDLHLSNGSTRTTNSSEILHIRGWTPRGGLVGMSPIQQHRAALGNWIAQQQYVGHFFRNNATPSGYIGLPEGADPDPIQMKEMLEAWSEAHSQENIHRPAILANGAKWESVGINLADVAFLDGMRFSVEEMSRMMFVPHLWVQPASTGERMASIEEAFILLAAYIIPRGKQIISALNADPDLFPPGQPLEAQFDFSPLYHTDQNTSSQRILRLRQGGIGSANECRIMEGLPPIDDPAYDLPIVIPVGGGALPGAELPPGSSLPDDDYSDVSPAGDLSVGDA